MARDLINKKFYYYQKDKHKLDLNSKTTCSKVLNAILIINYGSEFTIILNL